MGTKLTLLSASNTPMRRGSLIKEHQHIHYQLYYIDAGNPRFVINGTEVQIHPGQLFYISPYTPHEMLPLEDESMHFFEFKVQIVDAFIQSHLPQFSHPVVGGEYVRTVTDYIFRNWMSETPQNVENAETILEALFLGFFVQELHYDQNMVFRIRPQNDNVVAQKVMAYIGTNYNSDFSLQKLSEDLNYNSSYLSATFTKNTGITIVDYLNL